MSLLARALRRQRAVTLIALAVLTAMAWAWLLSGAGMGMAPTGWLWPVPAPAGAMHSMGEAPGMADMAGMDAMPGMAMPMAPAATAWGWADYLLTFSMWLVMMVAMMVPAAAPVVLLHDRAAAHHDPAKKPPSAQFVAGYLTVWAVFSLIAAGLQGMLHGSGLLASATMGPTGRWLPAAILLAAGAYQLSPWKDACLKFCRAPAVFLAAYYRSGPAGAFQMGLRHGAYCLGCCWLLMALLFAGGVMNLAWIALLTLLVAGEKLLPGGRRLAQAAGLGMIALAGAVAFA